MAVFKIMIEIQRQLFDLWNLKSVQIDSEYNDKFSRIDYIIWLNKDAMILEYKDIKFTYSTEEARDIDLQRINDVLDEHETAMVLHDDNKVIKKEYSKFNDIDDDSVEEDSENLK